MSIEKLIGGADQFYSLAVAYLFAFIPAGIARWAYYADQIRRGRRKLAIGLIVLECVTAMFCTYVGLGVADYLEWQLLSVKTAGLVALISYLGPNGILALALSFIKRRWPELDDKPVVPSSKSQS